MKFDMMRVRDNGTIVPRHNVGMLRTVRGTLHVGDERISDLKRFVRIATFRTEQGEALKLLDVMLMSATAERLVLSGFERGTCGNRDVDYAQTWVLIDCLGEEPMGTRGPPFER